jgi:hypothetical protein
LMATTSSTTMSPTFFGGKQSKSLHLCKPFASFFPCLGHYKVLEANF